MHFSILHHNILHKTDLTNSYLFHNLNHRLSNGLKIRTSQYLVLDGLILLQVPFSIIHLEAIQTLQHPYNQNQNFEKEIVYEALKIPDEVNEVVNETNDVCEVLPKYEER